MRTHCCIVALMYVATYFNHCNYSRNDNNSICSPILAKIVLTRMFEFSMQYAAIDSNHTSQSLLFLDKMIIIIIIIADVLLLYLLNEF